ncbi:Signal peptidase I [Verrucomicrobia bacterium]|nr:Signal peptidase I [Verrucomicrobiota bacterium]
MTTQVETKARPAWWQIVLVGRNPKHTVGRIIALVVVCALVRFFVLWPIQVQGVSMFPTYRDGRVNFVNHLAYVLHEPRRGDVVSIRLAGPHVMYMKRIVGLPGETVAFHQGHALINGRILDEPYVHGPCNWERPPVTLGPAQYFVVGDNRSMPLEDHTMGETQRDRIEGKVLL